MTVAPVQQDPTAWLLASCRAWVRRVLESKGWTAADWGRAADMNASSISRILDPKIKIVPSSETLARMAWAAGSQPDLLPAHLREDAKPADYGKINDLVLMLIVELQEANRGTRPPARASA